MSKKNETQEDNSLEQFSWGTEEPNSFFGITSVGDEDGDTDEVSTIDAYSKKSAIDSDTDQEEYEEVEMFGTKVSVSKEQGDKDSKTKKQTSAASTKQQQQEEGEEDDDDEDGNGDEDDNEADEEEDGDEEENKEDGEESSLDALAKDLVEKGILSTVDKKGDTLSAEDIFDSFEKEHETRLEEAIESFIEDTVSAQGKEFLSFLKNGGTAKEFFETYRDLSEIPTPGDNPDEQEKMELIEYYMANVEDKDAKEIREELEYLKDGGKIDSRFERYSAKLSKIKEEQIKEMNRIAKERKESQRKATEEFTDTIQKTVKEAEAISGIVITPEDKKELASYMTKPSVKVGKNSYMTPFAAEVNKVFSEQNPEQMILLAKLFKTKFNLDSLEREKKTSKVKEIKSNLQKQAESKKIGSGSGKTPRLKKSIADYL